MFVCVFFVSKRKRGTPNETKTNYEIRKGCIHESGIWMELKEKLLKKYVPGVNNGKKLFGGGTARHFSHKHL